MIKEFPKEEMFALSSQFRRAVDSIALNIAEGAGNSSAKEFSKFLDYSIRSVYECICCLDISIENKLINHDQYIKIFTHVDEVIAMLVGLKRKIQK